MGAQSKQDSRKTDTGGRKRAKVISKRGVSWRSERTSERANGQSGDDNRDKGKGK